MDTIIPTIWAKRKTIIEWKIRRVSADTIQMALFSQAHPPKDLFHGFSLVGPVVRDVIVIVHDVWVSSMSIGSGIDSDEVCANGGGVDETVTSSGQTPLWPQPHCLGPQPSCRSLHLRSSLSSGECSADIPGHHEDEMKFFTESMASTSRRDPVSALPHPVPSACWGVQLTEGGGRTWSVVRGISKLSWNWGPFWVLVTHVRKCPPPQTPTSDSP